jgi:hypothetical protein
MTDIILLPFIATVSSAISIIILNRFNKKQIPLDKHYALKALVVFLGGMLIMLILTHK